MNVTSCAGSRFITIPGGSRLTEAEIVDSIKSRHGDPGIEGDAIQFAHRMFHALDEMEIVRNWPVGYKIPPKRAPATLRSTSEAIQA